MKKYSLCFLFWTMACAVVGQEALNVVDSLLYNSQFDVAVKHLDAALRKISDEDKRITLENKRAEVLIRAGRFDEAEIQLEGLLSRSLSPYQRMITQSNRGFLFLNQGRNDHALTTLKEALDNLETQGRQNSLEGAQLLSYLGNLYLATGKYAQAEEQLRMALSIREGLVSENSELIAASYNDLGLIYSSTDANKALDHYEKALAIYESIHGKDHPKIAIASTNIGLVYRTLEFYGDAINNFESALNIWEKIYHEAHPTKAFIHFNLGQTYLKMRNEKAAGEFYEKALKTYRESYGKKHPAISTVLNAIGSLKMSSGEFDESVEYFQYALISNVSDFSETNLNYNPARENYYSGNTLLYALLGKAEALEARYFGKTLKFKELELALQTLHVCDSLIDDLRQQITNENDKILLGTIASEVYAAGVRIAFEAGQVAAKKKPWYEMSFFFAEKSKSAVLLGAISDSNAKSYSGIPANLLEDEKNIKAELAVITQKLSLKPSESEERYLREMKYTLSRNYENFVRDLENKFPSYYNLKFNVSAPSIKSIEEKLDDRTAIVSYFIDEKRNRLYIFQISKNRFKADAYGISTDFDRKVTGLRNSLIYNHLEVYKEAAESLSAVLVPEIPASITNLILIPTGKLSIIPFESLFYKKLKNEQSFHAFPYLLKKYNIRYEFSAAMILQKTKKPARPAQSIFLCAPVTFEKDRLVELPASETEVQEIAELFSSRNLSNVVFTRQHADESSVKASKLSEFTYLHFATHGIVDESNPELSRLYLSSSADKEDGNLYAGEIFNLQLNAKLVTLSACQTGLGKIFKGEGVIGLSRALVYAGADKIMVSFWNVADQSTAELMKHFYHELLSAPSDNLAESLKRAKLNLMHSDTYASPYFWAPFVLIGY